MDSLRPLGLPTTNPAPVSRPAMGDSPAPEPVDSAQVGAPAPFRLAVDAARVACAAVRSGAAGAAGPVLERELRSLELPLLKTKWLRLPFTAPHAPVTPDEALEFLPKDRLHVDLGQGARPVHEPQDLAALQHLRGVPAQRPAPPEAALLKPFTVAADSAERLEPYDGYLRLKAHEPILLLHDGLPILKGDDAAKLQVQLPGAAAAADAARGGGLSDVLRHTVAVVGDDVEALARVLPDLPVPEEFRASCLALLKAGVPAAEVVARQAAAEDAVETMVAGGLPVETARAAVEALRSAAERAQRPDLVDLLGRLAAGGNPDPFRDLLKDEALQAFDRALQAGRGLARSFAEVGGLADAVHRSGYGWMSPPVYAAYEGLLGTGEATAGAGFLREVVLAGVTGDEAVECLDLVRQNVTHASRGYPGLTFEERIAEFRALGLVAGKRQLRTPTWRAFCADVQGGLARDEARARLARLQEALKDQYYGYAEPVVAAYADHGAGRPDGADALAFLVDLAGRGILSDEAAAAMAALAQPAGALTLAQRVQLFGELKLAESHSTVRTAAWAAVKAELDGGAVKAQVLERVGRLQAACAELTYHGYVAPLYRAWADTVAGKPESDTAVGFLVDLVGKGIHGDEAEEALTELAVPAAKLTLAQRVQEFAALGLPGTESRTRIAIWKAFRRDLDGGAAPADARARVERLVGSFAGITDYHGYRVPVFGAWADGGAGTPDSDAAVDFLVGLVGKGIHGDDAAQAMAQVQQPVGALTLQERGRWFHDLGLSGEGPLSQGGVRSAAWAAFRSDVDAGVAPDVACGRVARLADALQANGAVYRGYVTPVLEAYGKAAGTVDAEAAVGFLVGLTAKGLRGEDAAQALALVLQPAGPLGLDQRMEAFHALGLSAAEGPLNTEKVRPAVYEAFRTDVAAGADAATAQARLGRLAAAYAGHGVTYNRYLEAGFAAWGRHFAGTPDAEAGIDLMAGLAAQHVEGDEATAVAAELALPAGPLTLAERATIFADTRLPATNSRLAAYAGFRKDVAAGTPARAAQSRVERLAKSLEGITYEGYLTPPFAAWSAHFAGTPDSDGGLAILEALGKAGIQGDEVATLAAAVAAPLKGLALGERFAAMQRLALDRPSGVRAATYDVFRREASEISVADAEGRVRALADAMTKASMNYAPTARGFLESYAENLAGDPVLAPRWATRLLEKGVTEAEIRESMEAAKRDLRPLLERADTEVVAAVNTFLSRPPRTPWPDEMRAIRTTVELLLAARRGPDEEGTIGHDGSDVVIGDIRLPRR